MKEGNAIEVRNVEKEFRVHLESSNQLKDAVIFGNRNKVQVRNVLRGVSFEIPKGQAVALIGKNGCGKSTSLKLLTKILKPNKGEVELKGRVSSLIELGAGFHPDMTGRENIYINASIFGIKHKEVDKRIDSIIRFSELEDVIDTPVRTYSSGMYMRLAFSVAINVNADILLIDEILAVGDSAFQEKCFNKLLDLKRSGLTIVIVSHSLGQVKRICDRCIWIKDGLIQMDGDVNKVCDEYEHDMFESSQERVKKEVQQTNDETLCVQDGSIDDFSCFEITSQCSAFAKREYVGPARILNIMMLDKDGNPNTVFHTGDEVKIVVDFDSPDKKLPLNVVLGFNNEVGYCFFGTASGLITKKYIFVEGKKRICFYFKSLIINNGTYNISVAIRNSEMKLIDKCHSVISFRMLASDDKFFGVCCQDCILEMSEEN